MIQPLATPSQLVQSQLVNRTPLLCMVCDCFIETFTGLPVILDEKEQLISFVHPGCCVRKT